MEFFFPRTASIIVRFATNMWFCKIIAGVESGRMSAYHISLHALVVVYRSISFFLFRVIHRRRVRSVALIHMYLKRLKQSKSWKAELNWVVCKASPRKCSKMQGKPKDCWPWRVLAHCFHQRLIHSWYVWLHLFKITRYHVHETLHLSNVVCTYLRSHCHVWALGVNL